MTILVHIYLLTALHMALMIWGRQTFAPIIPTFPPDPTMNAVINESVIVLAGEPVIVSVDIRVIVDCGEVIDRAIMSGIPNPTVNWLIDGIMLVNGSVPNVVISSDRRRLIIIDTLLAVGGGQTGNNGDYTCDVCIDFMDPNCNATTPVCVCGEPNISPPTSPAMVTPSFIQLTCGQDVVVPTLQGVATLLFQCKIFNGSFSILKVFKDGVQIHDNFPLIISPASNADFGTYTFRLSTECCGSTMAVSRIIRQDLTNEGNEFFVGFFRNRFSLVSEQERIDPVLWITTSESTPVSFNVSTIFGPLASGIAIRGEITYIDIPIALVVSDSSLGTDLQFKGIHIKADNDRRIAVFGHNEEQGSNDAYLGLPVVSLPAGRSYEYIAASIRGDEGTAQQAKDSVALIIGTENDTEIIVEIPFTNPLIITYDEATNRLLFPGTPVAFRTITIQRFQTLYLQVRGGDISGVRIIANKPISVFSGHECADIPIDSAPCDILIEQLQPIDTWGTEAVTVPLRTRSGDILKVFASQDSTAVNVTYTDISSGAVTTDSFTLNRNGFRELGGTSTGATGAISDFALIQSNNPIAVFQFSRSYTTDNEIVSDPFMLSVPSCEQYCDSYAVAPAPFNETTIGGVAARVAYVNYTNIVVPAEYFNASLITINNSPANASEFRPIRRADNSIWGYGAQLLLDEGAQVIRHQDRNAALSVTIYGFSNQQSWGSIGGTCLAPVSLFEEDCSVTSITGSFRHNRRRNRTILQFSSDNQRATYRCKLDDEKFENCNSPVVWRNLKRGRHTVVVSASCIDDEGNASSVRRTFKVRVR